MSTPSAPTLTLAQARCEARAALWRTVDHVGGAATWDVCVIGGGATGLGVALDAAARGYSVLLAEAQDFASGASSRSSKMLHGGVRYLQQADFALVREALHERATVLANAPHVAHKLKFVIPAASWAEAAFYGAGLKLYDLLAGGRNIGCSQLLSGAAVAQQAPALQRVAHGVQYFDGLFDDARLAQSIARTARSLGAVLLNHCRAEVQGTADDGAALVALQSRYPEAQTVVRARCVLQAQGAWSGERVMVARGSHVVLPDVGLYSGVLLPKTPDGRVLYLLPWLGHTIIGTTDVRVAAPDYATEAPEEDIAWLLATASTILRQALRREDVSASSVGYRPLVKPAGASTASSKLSRAHVVERTGARSLRIVGGKWTTYRRMAQDALDFAQRENILPQAQDCTTAHLPLLPNPLLDTAWQRQGLWTDAELYTLALCAISEEAACTPEDILYRRLRTGFTNQALAGQLAHSVAQGLG